METRLQQGPYVIREDVQQLVRRPSTGSLQQSMLSYMKAMENRKAMELMISCGSWKSTMDEAIGARTSTPPTYGPEQIITLLANLSKY